MSFRASRRRVEKSVFEQISPLRVPWGRFGRNDGEAFQQSNFIAEQKQQKIIYILYRISLLSGYKSNNINWLQKSVLSVL